MSAEPSPATAAKAAVSYLREVSPEMRGCAILDSDGTVLASTGSAEEGWGQMAADFAEASDGAGAGAGGEPATHSHVATAEGEAFLVRHGDLTAVAVTDRFVLASLMMFDMRAALREVASGGPAA